MNIENKKQLATLLLAAGLGLVAAFLLSQYVQNNIESERRQLEQRYERANKEQRDRLLKEMGLMQQEFNSKLAQLAKEQELQQKKLATAQAQAAAAAAAAKKPEVKEEQKSIPQSFSVMTPPGKRAFTINIVSLNAVGGLIKSGDRVDVISTLKIPDQGDSPGAESKEVTTVLFQDITVLAVGTQFITPTTAMTYEEQQRAKTLKVTLALDPQEAALLTFVEDYGQLKLSLRSPTETGTKLMDVATWDSLSDFLLEKQGTKINIPVTNIEEIEEKIEQEKIESKPKIQIFKSGLETSL